MTKALLAVAFVVAITGLAVAQGAADQNYATAAQALRALRDKPGVKVSVQSGWTVIEDRAALSVWSFAPVGHRAYPAAIQRKVVQDNGHVFVKMNVLCEASKSDCDALVAEFGKLNEHVRNDLGQKPR
jgi:hypothetical protein